ncbi:MAG: RNA polymerase-associated protein RapA [Zetaproteobacteria bacterium]|nr:RNA polymerase-associated protein RapA [Zetaproteobacteria bacterium]
MLQPGQWIQIRTEPELGPAKIIAVSEKSCELFFPKQKDRRTYATDSSQLHHLELGKGSTVQVLASGSIHNVEESRSRKDSFFEYLVQDTWEHETSIVPITLTTNMRTDPSFWPEEWSESSKFLLRMDAWELLSTSLASPVSGLVGARVEPMPHQLYLATTLTSRSHPRAILADEVGLGKTIEAGLVYSRLKAMGSAERVLILCPESLVSQWLVELSHRFGDWFTVIDEDYLEEISKQTGTCAFTSTQRAILSYATLDESPELAEQIATAGHWDMIIADEAHHLDWFTSDSSPLWNCANQIARACTSLLLLTATPRHHGLETLFGLLHLIDPEQYDDFEAFEKIEQDQEWVADIAKRLQQGSDNQQQRDKLAQFFAHDKLFAQKVSDPHTPANELIHALMDRHSTGLSVVRNRREVIQGFPMRQLHSVPLAASQEYLSHLQSLEVTEIPGVQLMDYATGRGHPRSFVHDYRNHPKFIWLATLLRQQPQKKVVVICATAQLAYEASKYLHEPSSQTGLRKQDICLFHDGLTFLERDQQAARFAHSEGARVLLCSQVGGEGRNFQFTDTIVFLDLPKLPDEVEQRVGRLDRIGQQKSVQIYVPWIQQSPEEVLFRWFNEGIGNFKRSTIGADPLLEEVAEELLDTIKAYFPNHPEYATREAQLDLLLHKTQTLEKQHRDQQAKSVDILIDAISYRAEKAQQLAEMVDDTDDDPRTENLLHRAFEAFGLDCEDLDGRGTYRVATGADLPRFVEYVPGIDTDKDLVFTFDRKTAIENESILFMSQESPLVLACMEYLTSPHNSHFSVAQVKGISGLQLELLFVLKTSGPRSLQLDKFLPVQTWTICLDHHGQAIEEKAYQKQKQLLTPLDPRDMQFSPTQARPHLLPILEKGISLSQDWQEQQISAACTFACTEQEPEISKAKYLASVNPHFSAKIADELEGKLATTLKMLRLSKARLDSVRLWVPA